MLSKRKPSFFPPKFVIKFTKNRIVSKSEKTTRERPEAALAASSNFPRLFGFVSFAKKTSGKTKIIFPK